MTEDDHMAVRSVVETLLCDAERAAADGRVSEALSQMLSAANLAQQSEGTDDREFVRRSHAILEHVVGRLQAHFGSSAWQLGSPPVDIPDLQNPRCSFCAKKQIAVAKLVSGYGVWICDECIRLCAEALE